MGVVKAEEVLHILLVPFQVESHINGLLRLAHVLAEQEGVIVTFAYPARAYTLSEKRKKKLGGFWSSKMRVEVVQDGLPTDEAQAPTQQDFLASVAVVQQNVKLLLDDLLHKGQHSSSDLHPPAVSCIISDTFTPWTQDLARAVGLPRVDFCPSSAAFYAMGAHLPDVVSKGHVPVQQSCWVDQKKWSLKSGVPFVDCVPGLPPFAITDLPHELIKEEDLSHPVIQFMLAAFAPAREAHTILVYSVYELERQVFDAMQARGFPIYAVGPLPYPCSVHAEANDENECLQWLDTQEPSSVIYIALGTMAHLTPAETHSLALGLELSGHPFLWVILPDTISGSLSDAYPEGFLDRTVAQGSGLIVSWAPQTDVLRHRSIGAFFSHCGWNSTLESLWEGVPMIACPRAAEQRSNGKWIVEHWKMGVELEREEDGSFTKEAVQRAMHSVLALPCKEGAVHAKQVARHAVQEGGSSHSNLFGFLQRLSHC